MFASRWTVAVLTVAVAVGCRSQAEDKPAHKLPAKVQTALEKADAFEVLSLDPENGTVEGKDAFHGWKILGKTTVKQAEVRKGLRTALEKGVADSDGSVARCFQPRHGLRVVAGGETIDLVVCFQCLQIQIYTGKGDKREPTVPTTGSPEPAFDKILKDAKVPLAPKPGA